MNKIEHIGIAVSDLKTAMLVYERLLGIPVYKTEYIPEQDVTTAFFNTGINKVELLEPASANSVIARFIAQKGEGMHHLAFEVDDIYAEIKRLKGEGFKLISDVPSVGADNKLVCFVHPKNANGVLIELCQEIKAV